MTERNAGGRGPMGQGEATASPSPAERRLAAVLYADAAGYTRMMRADEDGTLARLSARIDEVFAPSAARHGGRIVKLSGDGVLCEFASAFEALRAALEIQGESERRNADAPLAQRLVFRMGLHLGDVLVRGSDIYGDAVNLAARLQSIAAPGGVLLSAAAYEQVRDRASAPLADLGERRLKNIDRPVKVYAAGPRPRSPLPRKGIVALAASLALLALGAASWRLATPRGDPAAPEVEVALQRPMVAVLPFSNLSADAGQDYLSEGLTEDIRAALSRFRNLSVVASSVAMARGAEGSPRKEVAKSLGVRYLVEGNLRRSGDRFRVSVQLVDTGSERVLWAQQFDEEIKDAFEVQDRVVSSVAGALVANLDVAEAKRALAKRPDSLDAYDLVLRARAALAKRTRSENRAARQLLEQAIALDPDYAAAHVWHGTALFYQAMLGWTEFTEETFRAAKEAELRAIRLDDRDSHPHAILAGIHAVFSEFEHALLEADRALALNPSDSTSLSQRGRVLLIVGRAEEAIRSLEAARRLDPSFDPTNELYLGLAYYAARRYHDAAATGERLLSLDPGFPVGYALLAAAYGQLGRAAEAAAALGSQLKINPSYDLDAFGSFYRDAAQLAHLRDGLDRAKGR